MKPHNSPACSSNILDWEVGVSSKGKAMRRCDGGAMWGIGGGGELTTQPHGIWNIFSFVLWTRIIKSYASYLCGESVCKIFSKVRSKYLTLSYYGVRHIPYVSVFSAFLLELRLCWSYRPLGESSRSPPPGWSLHPQPRGWKMMTKLTMITDKSC